jgi:hypothetical protein
MERSVLNDKSAPFQRKAKGFVSRGLLSINPNDQHTGGAQELHQPIKRELQSFEGRRRQSTNAKSYWPAGWPQFAVAAARA